MKTDCATSSIIKKNLRTEHFQGISDAINRGCTRGDEMRKVIVLPTSHIGGRRYMIQN
jgi:hypothetical protein